MASCRRGVQEPPILPGAGRYRLERPVNAVSIQLFPNKSEGLTGPSKERGPMGAKMNGRLSPRGFSVSCPREVI